jgi:hypothetical protein
MLRVWSAAPRIQLASSPLMKCQGEIPRWRFAVALVELLTRSE